MNDTATTDTGPPTNMPQPPLVRPQEGRVIAGVAKGIADRLGIGTGWVRAGFVIATIMGGAGLALYVVGWLAIPEKGDDQSIASSRIANVEGLSRWLGVGLIAIGGLLVLGLTDIVRGELVWAAALVLAGVLLYRGELSVGRQSSGVGRVEQPPPAPAPPPPRPDFDIAEREEPPQLPEPPPPPAAQPRPPAPRIRSILGRLTLALMLIVIGGMAIFDNAGSIEPSAQHYVGAVLGVAGLGLLVGAWWGRARALIAVGLLLLPVLAVASVVNVPFSNDVGERTFTPTVPADVRHEYRLGAGDLTIDLRALELSAGRVPFEASVVAGRLTVIVPRDVAWEVDARVGFGEIRVSHPDGRGVLEEAGVSREIFISAPVDAASFIAATVEVGFGQVRVLER